MTAFAVETRALTKKFGDFTAVSGVTLQIEQGAVYGFLGPNGSGKSTTIRMLCGLLAPTSGEGLVLGMRLPQDGQKLKRRIGYMSQKFSLYQNLSVVENLTLYAGLYEIRGRERRARIQEMLELAGLQDRHNELAGELSGGLRQRLALGCSILHRPEILFLDEPTSGVDPKARLHFWDIIYDLAANGTTVMVTTHFMDEAEHCDQVAFISFGQLIADDSPEKLKSSIPGRLYEVDGGKGTEMVKELRGNGRQVLDAYPFGEKLHVLVPPESTLSDNGIFFGAHVTEIIPTMEDVFVFLVKEQAARNPAIVSGIGEGE